MHALARARYGQVPDARIHDRDGTGTCAGAPPGARTAQHAQGLRPSAETNDLGWPDQPPDDGLKLAGPDGLQIVLKIRGASALDVEAPDRAAPTRVPPAVNDRAMNPDGPRGGCQAGLVQLQVLVSGIADDQGDRDRALGNGIAPSWCAAARRLLGQHKIQSAGDLPVPAGCVTTLGRSSRRTCGPQGCDRLKHAHATHSIRHIHACGWVVARNRAVGTGEGLRSAAQLAFGRVAPLCGC
jgi:hypothetical protein